MDLFINEINACDLSKKRGNGMTHINELKDLIEKKKDYGYLRLVIHTDQGWVYSSIDDLNKKQINKIIFYRSSDEASYSEQAVRTDIYAPISDKLDKSYCFYDDILFQPIRNGFSVRFAGKHHGLLHLQKELAFNLQLLKQKSRQSRKAVISRCASYLLRAFMPKDIWLIADQSDSAGDKGELFFRYLVARKKQTRCHPVFLLKKNSPDYERIRKIGKVVPYMSWQHKLLHLLGRHVISSCSAREISSPFMSRSLYYGDLLQKNTIIYLSRNVTARDLSGELNRYYKNYRLLAATNHEEYESILQGDYAYEEGQIMLSGSPDFDSQCCERLYQTILDSERKD